MKRTIQIALIQLFAIVCLWIVAYSQQIGPNGASFNAAAPGAIGGTTSSTGQFTQLCSGVSPCTLPGTIGDIDAERSGTTGAYFFGTPGNGNDILDDGTTLHFTQSGSDRATMTTTGFSLVAGVTLQSTGGAIPTATCSGGSTGVSIAAGSTNNRGQITTSSSASTNCTITWSAAGVWGQAPFCTFVDGSASITPTAFATGACGTATCVFDFASAASKVVNWMCM